MVQEYGSIDTLLQQDIELFLVVLREISGKAIAGTGHMQGGATLTRELACQGTRYEFEKNRRRKMVLSTFQVAIAVKQNMKFILLPLMVNSIKTMVAKSKNERSGFMAISISRDYVSWRACVPTGLIRSGLAWSSVISSIAVFDRSNSYLSPQTISAFRVRFSVRGISDMTQYPGKRKTDAVDLTTDDVSARAVKATRTESPPYPQNISSGQRFGENTGFLPLVQLSQIDGADDEDAQASELVQGSQDSGESSTGNYVLYGL